MAGKLFPCSLVRGEETAVARDHVSAHTRLDVENELLDHQRLGSDVARLRFLACCLAKCREGQDEDHEGSRDEDREQDAPGDQPGLEGKAP